jgi:catechol 2,3-dioxygenase-like lactoylglutathione lyase family enzyme
MITGFNHTGFTVSNIDAVVDYYVGIIGLELISLADRPIEYVESVTTIRKSMRIAYLRGYGATIELIEYIGSDKNSSFSTVDNIGSGHICFNVDNMENIVDALKTKGIQFLGAPVLIPAGTNKGGFVVYAVGPNGIVTEFIQPPVL